MKKILGVIVLSLLFSGVAFAGWFDKDKIKVTNCYDPKEYKNYKQDVKANGSQDWAWEIDLKRDTAILSFTLPNGQLKLVKHTIKIKTDRYIIVTDGKTPDVQFDLKNEVYISENTQSIVDILGESKRNILLQCKFS